MSIVSDNYIVSHMYPLPRPAGIPFHLQGQPLPDGLQKHAMAAQQITVDSAYNHPNMLPLGRFLGTVWPQQNQPKFLGANERIAFEGTW
jgi:hypothetical protein